MDPPSDREPAPAETPGACVRALLRRADRAALATALARDGSARPYASLVLVAPDHGASPVLLISDLADHAKNLRADPRAALLFDGTGGGADPLAGPRATVLGDVRELEDEDVRAHLKARFLARHPSARAYADFGDFRLYRMTVDSAHLVAGFGRVHWVDAREVLFDAGPCARLAAAEADIVEHMNRDHAEALRLIAANLPGPAVPAAEAADWVMVGIDPEGFDLRAGPRLARADFDRPVPDAEAARAALVRLTKRARRLAAAG
ncbi:MAG: HugZ family protein [Kiloniellaceae bacterium]